MEVTNTMEILQILGWALTMFGQFQVTSKRKSGFAIWMVANCVLIVLNLKLGLYWSAAMFMTNFIACVWSYSAWSQEERSKHRYLFYRGSLR